MYNKNFLNYVKKRALETAEQPKEIISRVLKNERELENVLYIK